MRARVRGTDQDMAFFGDGTLNEIIRDNRGTVDNPGTVALTGLTYRNAVCGPAEAELCPVR